MPRLYLYTYTSNDCKLADNDALLTTNPHWSDLRVKENDQVFVFGGTFQSNGTSVPHVELDAQNIAVAKREFKLLNLEKKNRMVNQQVQNIIGANKPSAQAQRTSGIVDLNTLIISDFLRYLDRMTWENKLKGILSTISFEDAFDLAKPIFQDLLNISATIIDDTYNNTITDKEIEDAVKTSKLREEQITSDGVIKKSKKKKNVNKE
jgi:hypothetical protein